MSRFPILCLAVLLTPACTPRQPAGNSSVDINAAAMQAQGTVDAYGANADDVEIAETDAPTNATGAQADSFAPLDPPAPGTPGGLPDDRTPLSEAPFAPDSAQGAANIVQTYYALIGEAKYRQAFALRETGAVGPKTAEDFAADFARYSEYHANVGAPGAVDAGAGQRFVTVPVQVYARLKQDGTPVYQLGTVVLHRTGEIDGATVEQRKWHIRSSALKAAPKR